MLGVEISETKKIDVNSLYSILQLEIENDTVQEINPHIYSSICELIGNLKNQGYDGI